jgi:hypothetical protein
MVAPSSIFHGSETGGFRITRGQQGHSLILECWGYWEDDVVMAFSQASLQSLEQAPPSELLLDAALLKPQSSRGQDAMLVFMRRVSKNPPQSFRVRADNVLTQMQLTRLVRQAGLPAQFASLSKS